MKSSSLKEFFKLQKTDDIAARAIGASLSTAFPLIIAYLNGEPHMGTMGALGAFAFLSIENRQISYLLKKMAIISASFLTVIALGMWVAHYPWLTPLLVGTVTFIGFFIVRLLDIPQPGSFFVIMVCSMSCNIHANFSQALHNLLYVGIGLIGSTIFAVLVVLHMQHQKHMPPKIDTLSLKEHVERSFKEDSVFVLSSLHHASLLFLVTYLAIGIGLYNPFWATISCAAVIQPRTFDGIFLRHLQRIIGAFVGVGIASALLVYNPPLNVLFVIIVALNYFVEFFMKRNYALANFFTNPLALLLSTLASGGDYSSFDLIWGRYSAILFGSIFGMIGSWITMKAVEYYDPKELTYAHEDQEANDNDKNHPQ